MNLDELERGYLPVDGNNWIPTAVKDKIYHAFPELLAKPTDSGREG